MQMEIKIRSTKSEIRNKLRQIRNSKQFKNAKEDLIGGASIVRRSQDGHVVLTAYTDIFQIRRLHKRVNTREVRHFTTTEGEDPTIYDGICSRQAQFQASRDFLIMFPVWQQGHDLDQGGCD